MEPQGEPPALDDSALEELRAAVRRRDQPGAATLLGQEGRRQEALRAGTERPTPRGGAQDASRFTTSGWSREAEDLLTVEVTTSTGFYVRSLAHDIGVELGCGASSPTTCAASRSGPYTVGKRAATV